MNKFGENLLWLLHDASVTLNDISDSIDGAEVEIYGEDEFGREGMTTVYVPDLLMSANSEINRVDSENMALREALRLKELECEALVQDKRKLVDVATWLHEKLIVDGERYVFSTKCGQTRELLSKMRGGNE